MRAEIVQSRAQIAPILILRFWSYITALSRPWFHSLIDSQPQINKLIVLNDPRRLSAIFLNESVRYCFEKPKIKIVIQGVNNHFDS